MDLAPLKEKKWDRKRIWGFAVLISLFRTKILVLRYIIFSPLRNLAVTWTCFFKVSGKITGSGSWKFHLRHCCCSVATFYYTIFLQAGGLGINFSTIEGGTVEVFNISGDWNATILSKSKRSQTFFTKITKIHFPNYFN